jgi:protein-S-isoprenylcysteine O-methyltransferase Ste14
MTSGILKSVLHNLGVTVVSLCVGGLGLLVDMLLSLRNFGSVTAAIAGVIFLAVGFLLRAWATVLFYEHRMKVIVLEPQQTLLTSGPYRFTRNPLYLGGNVLMFLGAAFLLGSPGGILLTALGLIPTQIMIRREERQLARRFGDEWAHYAARVRRWI